MRHRALAVVSLVASILGITYGSDAHASWNREHGSQCFPMFGAYWEDQNYTVHNGANGDVNLELMCPAPDTDVNPKYSWTTVNVETNLGGSYGTVAAICEDYWNGSGGACSASGVVLGSGHQTIALGGSVSGVWSSYGESNFGYIYVNVGAGDDVRGIFYAD